MTQQEAPHSVTGETANYMMFGGELMLPDNLISGPRENYQTREDYVADLEDRIYAAYELIREQQSKIRSNDNLIIISRSHLCFNKTTWSG